MGRTLASATQTWNEEEKALHRFRHALRKGDQALIDELMALAHTHIAEASYASNLYPMDVYLISMLIELLKKLKNLEIQLQKNGALPESEFNELRGITSLLELTHANTPLPEEETDPNINEPEYIDLEDSA